MGYITFGLKEHMGACFRDVFSVQSDMFKYTCNLGMCVCMHAHVRACLCSCMHTFVCTCIHGHVCMRVGGMNVRVCV
jgi:hypothetical protein